MHQFGRAMWIGVLMLPGYGTPMAWVPGRLYASNRERSLSAADTVAHADSVAPPKATSAHLTVRPRTMATGARNATPGVQRLAGVHETWVYVPPRCVGTRRVPLVVYLGGAGHDARDVIQRAQAFADRYGMIVLAPDAVAAPGLWDVMPGNGTAETAPQTGTSVHVVAFRDSDVKNIDAALRVTLHRYAIDPTRIALAGFSNGGSYALFLGRSNVDIFSRIAPLSALIPFDGLGSANHQRTAAQFFLSGGYAEDMVEQTLAVARELRQEGYPVKTVLGLRPHVEYPVDNEYMWHWLAQSWAEPLVTARAMPPVGADSDPVLTDTVLRQMTAFWQRFAQEPMAICDSARMKHQVPLGVWLGDQPAWVLKADMITLAAQYPSVAADLRGVGLTAQQEEAYRRAIIRTGMTWAASRVVGTISPQSVLEENLMFWNVHEQEETALEDTGMWTMQ